VDGSWYFKLLRDGRSVADIRDKLMFGESNIGDVGHQGQSKAAAMADTDEVCGCNGVTKGAICKAIKDKGLFTLDEVRKQTKASASCGSCTGLVEQILMFTAGGDYSATPKLKPMCGCTEHGHQAVRDAVREFARHGLTKLVIVNGHYENQWFLIEGIDLGLRGQQHHVAFNDVAGGALLGLGHILRNLRHAPLRGNRILAAVFMQRAVEHGKQRGLARAIAPHQADFFAGIEGDRRAVENHFGAATQHHVFKGNHWTNRLKKSIRTAASRHRS